MDFKQLASFVAVVRYKSFTKAAEHLFLSQPTISAHIQQLENQLNKRLIVRTTKSIQVTQKGSEVYDYAVRILALRDRLTECCAVQPQKIIHLGASTIPSAYILPDVLPVFGERFPDTYFAIHQGDSQVIVNGLKEGLFDVGLIGMKAQDEQVDCIPFCEDSMVIITPVNQHFLALKRNPAVSVRELLCEPIIVRESADGSKKNADRLLESMGIANEELNIIARINDQEAIKRLVAGGLGISMISQIAAKNFIAEKRILSFSLNEYNAKRSLYIISRKNDMIQPHVENFIRFIRRNNWN